MEESTGNQEYKGKLMNGEPVVEWDRIDKNEKFLQKVQRVGEALNVATEDDPKVKKKRRVLQTQAVSTQSD